MGDPCDSTGPVSGRQVPCLGHWAGLTMGLGRPFSAEGSDLVTSHDRTFLTAPRGAVTHPPFSCHSLLYFPPWRRHPNNEASGREGVAPACPLPGAGLRVVPCVPGVGATCWAAGQPRRSVDRRAVQCGSRCGFVTCLFPGRWRAVPKCTACSSLTRCHWLCSIHWWMGRRHTAICPLLVFPVAQDNPSSEGLEHEDEFPEGKGQIKRWEHRKVFKTLIFFNCFPELGKLDYHRQCKLVPTKHFLETTTISGTKDSI